MHMTSISTTAKIFLTTLGLTLGLSCAASPERNSVPTASGHPASITLRDYRSGIVLTLINDSVLLARNVPGDNVPLRRAAYYSQLDRQSTAKVAGDELVEGMMQAFENRGFFGIATGGPSPERASDVSTSLEVSRNGRSDHLMFSTRMSRDGQLVYSDCRKVFSEVYNRVDQYYSASSIPTAVPKARKR